MITSRLSGIQSSKHGRRGVLLLVVLSMLTLFLLLGVTFIVLASRARTVSRAYLQLADQQQQSTSTLQPLVRDAALQVMRGTTKDSALKHHDLLGDRYGQQAVSYSVTVASSVAANQLLKIGLNTSLGLNKTGCVLYFVTGPSAVQGHGARIVDVVDGEAIIEWPPGLSPSGLSGLTGATVEINHRDFDGEGVDAQTAYEPNWSLVPTVSPNGINEDYDAVDLQNIAMAEAGQAVASYHRPSSIDYWVEWYRAQKNLQDTASAQEKIFEILPVDPGDLQDPVDLEVVKQLRRASCRPFPFDHLFNFYDGSNGRSYEDFAGQTFNSASSFFSLLKGGSGFDVDTDGDGQLDSVWLDFGREAFRLADQTYVKPLAAIRCIDLGGRINVNAHGSLSHLTGTLPSADSALAGGGTSQYSYLFDSQPVGLGYGPADIQMGAVLSNQQMRDIFLGRAQDAYQGNGTFRKLPPLNGRYGGGVRSLGSPPMPGPTADNDALGLIGSHVSLLPTDYWSRYSMGLDHRGHPRFYSWFNHNDTSNSPYELNLLESADATPYVPRSGNVSQLDQPFTATELEALLRFRDADNAALLPQRLLGIFLASDPALYNLLTTESWDTPAIIGDVPNVSGTNPEIKRGLRFNLNHPFGDGLDNDGDGFVDEPDETGDGIDSDGDNQTDEEGELQRGFVIDPFGVAIEPDSGNPNAADDSSTTNVDESGSGWNITRGEVIAGLPDVGPDSQPGKNYAGLRARQLMADNLYNLLKFLDPPNLLDQELAQWSVNVVDFIDSDSIMTPYRYASGAPDQYVVWGCESPDLIITETIAFHDRAIADMDDDDGEDDNQDDSGQKTTDGSDSDFDQVRVPQGSLFLELHAVRNRNATHQLPRELYNGSSGDWSLDLGRVPAGSTAPVWRLSFAELRNNASSFNDPFKKIHDNNYEVLSPSDSDEYSLPGGISTDRYAYFTKDLTLPSNESGKHLKPNRYNTFRSATNVELKCGDYLVAGSRPRTYFGSTSGGVGNRSTQQIELQNNGVKIQWLDNSQVPSDGTLNGFTESHGVTLQADSLDGSSWQSIGLNVSEPLAYEYYPAPPSQSNADSATPMYGPMYPDTPSDNSGGSPLRAAGLLNQGTHLNASTVFVERLADPTSPYQPDADMPGWNPYIVVDFMPIDLTVFNGETATRDPSVSADISWHVQSRQRGFDAWIDQNPDGKDAELFSLEKVKTGASDRVVSKYPWRPCSPWEKNGNTWQPRPPQPKVSTSLSSNAYFNYNVGDSPADEIPTHSLGWCNWSQGQRLASPAGYEGSPEVPFPWIVWKDGPLANPYELLMVPRTPASRLLTDYRDVGSLTDAGADHTNADGDPQPFGVDEDQPFGATRPGHHLLPLTSITDRPSEDKDNPSTPDSDSLSKIFGYVRTPSPFAGTRNAFTVNEGDTTPPFFRPPFNQAETYREPGRINVNTVRDESIWKAILGDRSSSGSQNLKPYWSDLQNEFQNVSKPIRTASGKRRINSGPKPLSDFSRR